MWHLQVMNHCNRTIIIREWQHYKKCSYINVFCFAGLGVEKISSTAQNVTYVCQSPWKTRIRWAQDSSFWYSPASTSLYVVHITRKCCVGNQWLTILYHERSWKKKRKYYTLRIISCVEPLFRLRICQLCVQYYGAVLSHRDTMHCWYCYGIPALLWISGHQCHSQMYD